ncbi:MAG: hypothetical protein NC115_05220 [Bacteroidales bacterium]|nr:hypothetical protein [Bacteroidales bacterium]
MEESVRNSLLDSPLYALVERNWTRWEQGISAVQVQDEDFLLYLVWGLDLIKEQDGDVNRRFRDIVFSAIRGHFIRCGYASNRDDVAYLADLVSAGCMFCYGLVLTESLRYLNVYDELLKGLGEDWKRINEIKRGIEDEGVCQMVKEWMIGYMNSDKYYTEKDEIKWAEGDGSEVLIRRSKSKKVAKVDLYRVIMALYRLGVFESADGSKLGPDKVFETFGNMLGEDFSAYANNLSGGSNNKGDLSIFGRLEEAFEKYEEEKERKKSERR